MIRAEHYRREQDGLQNEQRGSTGELMRPEREISEIQRWLGELAVLKNRFAPSRTPMCWSSSCSPPRTPTTSWCAGAVPPVLQRGPDERLRDLENA